MNKRRARTVLRAQNRQAFRAMVKRKEEAGDLPVPEYVRPEYKGSLSGKVAEAEEE